jgi:molybdopterin-binding aldehyde dehydrogenase-like protein
MRSNSARHAASTSGSAISCSICSTTKTEASGSSVRSPLGARRKTVPLAMRRCKVGRSGVSASASAAGHARQTRCRGRVRRRPSHHASRPCQQSAGLKTAPHVHGLLIAAFVLQLPEHKLRVIAPDVGGGFGTKGSLYAEQALVLWRASSAARSCARPLANERRDQAARRTTELVRRRWSAGARVSAASALAGRYGGEHGWFGEIRVGSAGRWRT